MTAQGDTLGITRMLRAEEIALCAGISPAKLKRLLRDLAISPAWTLARIPLYGADEIRRIREALDNIAAFEAEETRRKPRAARRRAAT